MTTDDHSRNTPSTIQPDKQPQSWCGRGCSLRCLVSLEVDGYLLSPVIRGRQLSPGFIEQWVSRSYRSRDLEIRRQDDAPFGVFEAILSFGALADSEAIL